jgi:hypothetical protein
MIGCNVQKLNRMMEKNLWERCKTIMNSVAEEVLGIMEPANKGMWFDAEYRAASEDKNKA